MTAQIIAALDGSNGDTQRPWHSVGTPIQMPVNAKTGQRYRGINTVALWAEAFARGYPSGVWCTYRGWQEIGAQVRGGEHGAQMVFWTEIAPDGDDEAERRHVVARGYTVFNAAQVHGWEPPALPVLSEAARIAHPEAFFANLGADVRHGGDRAFYHRYEDFVQMPPFAQFRDAQDYYAVLGHECVHWTGAGHRLDRDLSGRFGSQAYAAEELVAELGAAFLCALLGISSAPRADHTQYVASWIGLLRSDPRAIFTASSAAQKACDWLVGQQLQQTVAAA